MNELCASSFLSQYQIPLIAKIKGLLWLTASGISVLWPPCFHSMVACHRVGKWLCKIIHLMTRNQKEEKEEDGVVELLIFY